MRTTGKKRAIRSALYRLGLHTTPKAVAHTLREQGILVDEQLVRAVLVEMRKEPSRGRNVEVPRPVPSAGVRRRPKGFPGRQGRR